MSIKTDAQLTVAVNVIKNETTAGANTANRVGTLLSDFVDSKVNKDIYGLNKLVLIDAATITIDTSAVYNFFTLASIAANRNIVLSNITDKKSGIIIISATNGFKLIYNSTTLNLPTSGATTVSYLIDGTNVIWEITPIVIIDSTVATYDTNAQAYFTSLAATDGTVTTPQKTAYNKMVVDLKAVNLYAKFAHLGTALGGTAQSHAIDAITATNLLTYVPTVDHTALGMDPAAAGTGGYINTNIIGNTLSPLNFSMFIKLTENTLGVANSTDFGKIDDANNLKFSFSAKDGGNNMLIFHGSGAINDIPNTDAIGLYAMTSKSATDLRVYKNNTIVKTFTGDRTAAVFPNTSLLLGSGDTAGAYLSNRNIAFYAFGTGFTDAETLQAQTIITTFLAAI